MFKIRRGHWLVKFSVRILINPAMTISSAPCSASAWEMAASNAAWLPRAFRLHTTAGTPALAARVRA